MATFRKGNYVADLGAMVVTGLGKSQMFLSVQLSMLKIHKMHKRCEQHIFLYIFLYFCIYFCVCVHKQF